jgi:hypothetical protein
LRRRGSKKKPWRGPSAAERNRLRSYLERAFGNRWRVLRKLDTRERQDPPQEASRIKNARIIHLKAARAERTTGPVCNS